MWRSDLRDKSSGRYLRGVFFFFLTVLIIIAIGFGTSQYILKSDNSYEWKSTEAVLPIASQDRYPVTESGESPFVAVVESTRDAVVNISAEGDNPRAENIDPMWRSFLGIPPRISSYGSGFLIRPDGYIITNNHVVAGGDKVIVSLSDKRTFSAEIIGTDPQTDLAVIKIEASDSLPHIPLGDSEKMRVGDWVLAIGNPFPEQGLDRTVTVGVVSAKSRRNLRFGSDTPAYQDYIQTDASINPGNSGGPLVNLKGEAIGINSAIASPNRGSVGIGFAIPSNMARDIVSNLIEKGRVSRGWLGVTLEEVTPDQAEASGLETPAGVLIANVIQGSPASSAGLQAYDIVLEFNGKKVSDIYTFRLMVAAQQIGEDATLKISRDGREKSLRVILGDRDQSMATVFGQPVPEERASELDIHSWMGMEVESSSRQLADQFKVEYHPGVIVTDIQSGSVADKKNISPGTIITKIDFKDVRNKEDFIQIADELKDRKKAIAFYIFDLNGNIGYVALKQ
jgi:Do/DeqQ family serine protease